MAAKAWMTTRDVLWFLVFFGFAVNYMIRVNLNIAIVAMVKEGRGSRNNGSHQSECHQEKSIANITSIDMDDTTQSVLMQRREFRYDWDEYQQGLILGGFFWLHWTTQIPGGILAQKYGTKLVFGLGNFLACLLAVLVPVCAGIHYQALVVLRVLQGIISGVAWPSMHNMAANWIPPNERSKFVTAYLGSSVGAAVTFPMCGFLIDWFDWPSVFYMTGVIGALWFVAWCLMVYDSPAKHPRISQKEQQYIENCLGQAVSERKPPTPWKSIFMSVPMWMNILAQWGGIWGLFTLLTQAPTYFKYIHGMNMHMTGILSGIPHVVRVVFAVLISFLGDYLLQKNILSRTLVRKLATAVCTIGQGAFVLGLAFSGCNSLASVICLTLAVGTSGAVSTGQLASLVDISPNYASIILGIANMVTVVPGFISPLIVGNLTYQNQTSGQWQLVFLISFFMLVVPGLLHLIFSSSELQAWNTPDSPAKEMQKMNVNNNEEEDEKSKHHQNGICE